MSENLPTPESYTGGVPMRNGGPVELGPPEPYAQPDFGVPEDSGTDMGRYLSAVLRYKWAILAIMLVGAGVGFYLARGIRPLYVAQATIWIETPDDGRSRATPQGPIQSANLLESAAWVALLRSYAVLDDVVREQRLYLDFPAVDSAAFPGFRLTERFLPGAYELEVSRDGSTYQLKGDRGLVLETGAVGDSIGRAIGFAWLPPRRMLTPERAIRFGVLTPRDAAIRLRDRIRADLPEDYGSFLSLELEGNNAARLASTLNAVADRFVEVAADLKRNNSEALTAILEEQLAQAASNLTQAEMELEAFRVQTITLPSDESSPVTPGLEATRDPAFESFFALRIEREQLRRDGAAIRDALAAQAQTGASPTERLWPIASVQTSADLHQALEELTTKQAELRTLRTRFTDEHAQVRLLSGEVANLEGVVVPRLADALLTQIEERERTLESLIGSASTELRQIPPRMIEEARLERRVAIAETIYQDVQSRYEAARLAAASSIPDVRILDRATVPHTVTNPTARPQMILMALIGSLGFAIVGALLLDRFDKRFRYPKQVTSEMGLPILGAIQLAPPNASIGSDMIEQVVEAFRELRLSVAAAHGAGPIIVTVTSAGSGDGKSFVSSNLALAFGDLGYKTLVIDGDIRRGTLHHVLSGRRKPGLTDYLAGEIALESLVQTTEYPNVSFIGAGAWRRSGPEMLASAGMRELLATMRSRYRVIIVDSSPLGAGVDPFVLGTVTGSMLLVFRTGATDRELAGSKLDALQRLPIRILGAVLNAVPARGAYRYYSYLSSYQLPPDESDVEPESAEEPAPA